MFEILAAALVLSSLAEPSRLPLTIPPVNPGSMVILPSLDCIDVAGASIEPGASIVQETCRLGCTPSQVWSQVNATSEGWVQLVNQNSGLCMTVPSQVDGAPVAQDTCDAATHIQRWTLQEVGANFYAVINIHSGLCLTLPGSSKESGVQLVQSACQAGAQNQAIQFAHPSTCRPAR